MPSVEQSLAMYNWYLMRYLLPASLIVSVLPIREWAYTGNRGTVFFAPIAPLILLIGSGLVYVVWWILLLTSTIVGKINAFAFKRSVS